METAGMPWLKVRGDRIVDEAGRDTPLRGFCVGGWLNLENFINGYPGHPQTYRRALEGVLGTRKTAFFFDRMADHFLAETDVRFMAGLGANVLRIPMNYRWFEDDARPFTWKHEGFRRLDAAIEWCARNGMYAILDLHAAQGWQNHDWHSDNPTNAALLWFHPHFQDRVAGLWVELAKRYRRNAAVAGYNLLNEPVCTVPGGLPKLYRRLAREIRRHDRNHILFLEGNWFSSNFSELEAAVDRNTVFSNHHYPPPAFVDAPYPGKAWGSRHDRASILKAQRGLTEFMRKNRLPVWTGEFGAIFRGTRRDADRLRVVEDSISIFNEQGHSWTIWTYKDCGMMGTVTLDPDSPWMRHTKGLWRIKREMGMETWGQVADAAVPRAIDALKAKVLAVGRRHGYRLDPGDFWLPFGMASRMIGGLLVSEVVLKSFAERFRGLSEKKLEALAASFAFGQCRVREPLAEVIRSGT